MMSEKTKLWWKQVLTLTHLQFVVVGICMGEAGALWARSGEYRLFICSVALFLIMSKVSFNEETPCK